MRLSHLFFFFKSVVLIIRPYVGASFAKNRSEVMVSNVAKNGTCRKRDLLNTFVPLWCALCPERKKTPASQTPGSGRGQNQIKESQSGWCKSCGKSTHTHVTNNAWPFFFFLPWFLGIDIIYNIFFSEEGSQSHHVTQLKKKQTFDLLNSVNTVTWVTSPFLKEFLRW